MRLYHKEYRFLTMKFAILLYLNFILIFNDGFVNAAMTENQLKATVKLVRNTCQPKTKATNEDIEKMHQGDWDIDRSAMCYMQCALNMNKLMTPENTFNYDYAVVTAKKTLPEARKAATLETADQCKNSAKTLDDKCKAAYEIAKCIYESNPSVIDVLKSVSSENSTLNFMGRIDYVGIGLKITSSLES